MLVAALTQLHVIVQGAGRAPSDANDLAQQPISAHHGCFVHRALQLVEREPQGEVGARPAAPHRRQAAINFGAVAERLRDALRLALLRLPRIDLSQQRAQHALHLA